MPIPLKKYWEIMPPPPPEVVKGLADYSSNMQQFLYNRHIETEAAAHNYLNVSGPIHNPYDLSGMQAAVDRIIYAIVHHESVVVYGDYDVDGVTATALLTQLLKQLGADVHEYFPDRFEEGYGVNSNALENLHENGVRLVITVDCGARSCREAERARQIGLDLIITDHHEPEHELPIAHAIICHRQPGDNYPDKNLSGVGLAFKLAQALLEKYPFSGCSMDDFYDLVAIGTVADVVPLIGENRSLVKAGLHKIRTHPRQGLFSLSRVAGIPVGRCTSRDIGFGLGPRLNAAGRLETALDAYHMILAEDEHVAGELAQRLDDRNQKRQKITAHLYLLADEALAGAEDRLILYQIFPDKLEITEGGGEERIMGVVGLVASRLSEGYYRPAIVASQGEEFTRASCRSIPEFHITHALDECSDLFIRHGGHAAAAGFTIANEKLPELKERLDGIANRLLSNQILLPILHADMLVDLNKARFEEIRQLREDIDFLEPTGEGNREPYFVSKDVKLEGRSSKDGKHLLLKVKGYATWDGIAFRQGYWAGNLPPKCDIIYALEINEFNGIQRYQLNVRDIRPAGDNN